MTSSRSFDRRREARNGLKVYVDSGDRGDDTRNTAALAKAYREVWWRQRVPGALGWGRLGVAVIASILFGSI